MKNLPKINDKRLITLPIILGFVLIALFIFLNYNKKTASSPQSATSSAKISTRSGNVLTNRVLVKVIKIDAGSRTLTVVTWEKPKKTYQIKVPLKAKITQPSPVPGDKPQTTTYYPPISKKFEDFRVGSVLGVNSKENPTSATNLTAVMIIILV